MRQKIVDTSIIFIALILLAIVLRALQSVLIPFVVAILLSVLLMPVIRHAKKRKVPYVVVSLFLLIGFILFLSLGRVASPPDPVQDVTVGANRLQMLVEEFAGSTMGQLFDPEQLNQFVLTSMKILLATIRSLFSSLFLVFLFLLFILPSYDRSIKAMKKMLPQQKKVGTFFKNVEHSIRDYLVIKTLISLGTAIVSVVILSLFQVNFLFLFGFLFFALNYIPSVGSVVAVLAATVFAALTLGVSTTILWLFLSLMLVQMLFGGFLEPKIAGDKLSLSPIVILLSLFIWGWIWGITGMLLAVPLTSTLRIALDHLPKKFFS